VTGQSRISKILQPESKRLSNVLRKGGVKKEHFEALPDQIMEQATASFANWPAAV
jgi:hypothetical protein